MVMMNFIFGQNGGQTYAFPVVVFVVLCGDLSRSQSDLFSSHDTYRNARTKKKEEEFK